MSLRCRLTSHVAAPTCRTNQGFVFSQCRRCGRDMIRSAARTTSGRWHKVPSGFRVMRPDHRAALSGRRRARPGYSLAWDLPRLAGTALFWCLIDAVRGTPGPRAPVRRLSAA